jgi:hypothetical protein
MFCTDCEVFYGLFVTLDLFKSPKQGRHNFLQFPNKDVFPLLNSDGFTQGRDSGIEKPL